MKEIQRKTEREREIKRNHTTLNYKYFDKMFKEYLHGVLTISASLHHESLNDSFAQLNVLLTIHQNKRELHSNEFKRSKATATARTRTRWI